MAKKTKIVEETWVYTGRVSDRSGRVFHEYAQVGEVVNGEPELSETMWYSKKLVKFIGVGCLLKVQVDRSEGKSTVQGDGREYIGPSEFPQVEMWIVRDQVTADEKKAEGKVKRDLKDASLNSILEPIRVVYWNTSPTGRAALIGRVIYEITKGRI